MCTSNADERNTRPALKEGQTNPRGIPLAPFVEKLEDCVSSREDVEPALKKFQEMIVCVPGAKPVVEIAQSARAD
jgi:hypothetical protein